MRPDFAFGDDDGTLFLTTAGEAFAANRMTQLVRNYVAAADTGKTGSCHLLRHTMATLMLEGGADIRFIQAMLGHAELSNTQISIRMLKQIHTATHPGRPIGTKRRDATAENAGDERAALLSSGLIGTKESFWGFPWSLWRATVGDAHRYQRFRFSP